MRVVIIGHHLPGRSFPQRDAEERINVHVGLQRRSDPVELVPGDAAAARWEMDVDVVTAEDGALDFRGPVVQGKRGERFVYLTWGEVRRDDSFQMFRRAKLMLSRIDPQMVRAADQPGEALIGTIDLTDDHGWPRCARVDPPALMWAVGQA